MIQEIKKRQIEIPNEADYLALQKLSLKLGIPTPMVFLSLKVERDGKILAEHRQRSHTWTRNFWNALICQAASVPGVATNFGAGYLSFKNTAGTVSAYTISSEQWTLIGVVNNSAYGIVVGYGTAAESFEGYNLANVCANGTGTNQLIYAAASAQVQSYDAPSKTWTITNKRLMNNNSGAQIVIAEAAIIFFSASMSGNIMFNRDLLGATVNVANGAQLTVTYLITLTFPA